MPNLSIVMLPSSAWESITSEIQELKEILINKNQESDSRIWLSSEEARRMLGVCRKTWQTYRDRRVLPFVQSGRKIYVKKEDVESYLQDHMIGANQKGGNK